MVGHVRQNIAIEALRLAQPAVPVMIQRLGQFIGERVFEQREVHRYSSSCP